MKISNKVTKQLGKLIAGDTGIAPYLTGPLLVVSMSVVSMKFTETVSLPDGYMQRIRLLNPMAQIN